MTVSIQCNLKRNSGAGTIPAWALKAMHVDERLLFKTGSFGLFSEQ
jgi:hypothetical protein